MRFSIVVPTLNEAILLPNLLADLQSQTFKDFETIIADAGSQDGTPELALLAGVRLVPGGMPAVGRNRGAEAAQGEFLVFLDADTRVQPDFLEKASAELEDRFLDLATCEIVPLSSSVLDGVLHDFANLAIKVGQFTEPHAPGFCIIISRRLFRRIGGFDETLKMAEDHELVKRASQHRPLRVLNNAQVQVSVRRLEKEGRTRLISKYVAVELYRALFGEIQTEIFEYQFGNFTAEEQARLDASLSRSQKQLSHLRSRYLQLLRDAGGHISQIPKEALEAVKTQFDALREHLREILKIIRREP